MYCVNQKLRKGKWTIEEEKYANKIIEAFCDGTLMLPDNSNSTTLRAFLAEKLLCDPMRITKKYAGVSSLGKRVFHATTCSQSPDVVARVQKELDVLESKFKERLQVASSRNDYLTNNAFMNSVLLSEQAAAPQLYSQFRVPYPHPLPQPRWIPSPHTLALSAAVGQSHAMLGEQGMGCHGINAFLNAHQLAVSCGPQHSQQHLGDPIIGLGSPAWMMQGRGPYGHPGLSSHAAHAAHAVHAAHAAHPPSLAAHMPPFYPLQVPYGELEQRLQMRGMDRMLSLGNQSVAKRKVLEESTADSCSTSGESDNEGGFVRNCPMVSQPVSFGAAQGQDVVMAGMSVASAHARASSLLKQLQKQEPEGQGHVRLSPSSSTDSDQHSTEKDSDSSASSAGDNHHASKKRRIMQKVEASLAASSESQSDLTSDVPETKTYDDAAGFAPKGPPDAEDQCDAANSLLGLFMAAH